MKKPGLFILSFLIIVIGFTLIFAVYIANSVSSYTDRFHIDEQKRVLSLTLAYNKELYEKADSETEKQKLLEEFNSINSAQAYLWLFDSYKKDIVRSLVISAGFLAFLLLIAWHLSLYGIIRRQLNSLSNINFVLEKYVHTGKIETIKNYGPRAFKRMTDHFNSLLNDLKQAGIREKLQSQMEGWQNITRVLGHEIKNKLVPIKLTLDLVIDDLQSSKYTLNEVEEDLFLIQNNVEFIEKILNSLKSLTHIPPAECREINIIEEVDKIIQNNPSFALVEHKKNKGFSRQIFTDPFYLQLILTNLIKNSLEATSDDTRKISLSYFVDGKELVLLIRDNGVGFGEETASRIFRPGWTSKKEGDGLGLFIVRELCRALSIGLDFHSQEGKGTEFKMIFNQREKGK
ncbi:MAG: HAMP domain-containing histidine kinase [Spirochaetaceae bacterium]|nr:HAMP domain-containing histidine kinase [Spirochaetaceae bacterium]